jgi:hypothetical protein
MHVFGIGGLMIFQGFKFGIIKQLKEKDAPFMLGIYIMLNITLISWCSFLTLGLGVSILFMHSPKHHLEGTSLLNS